MSKQYTQTATKVSIVSIFVNFGLAVSKVCAGIFAHSYAVLSDGINSAGDVFSRFITLIGIRLAGKEEDEKHKYGHERFESVAAIILAVIICATGIMVGYNGIKMIIDGSYKELAVPGKIALIVAAGSIVVKEIMYHVTMHYGKKINSDALKADAWDNRTDVLSSAGSLVGAVGAMCGVGILDSIASIVIALMIIRSAFMIFREAIRKMTDEACDEATEAKMRACIMGQSGVLSVDMLKTRLFGNRIYVEIEIAVDKDIRLEEAHNIAEKVHDEIEKEFEDVKHCTVHVNPYIGQSEQDACDKDIPSQQQN
ncbi:MAG: cation diffusion facilitator family transporter [Christensenellales bacterium]